MNWKSIIATALITGIVTIGTGMLLFWWQSEKSELTYNSIQSIPFDDSSNRLFIQQVEIKNSGDKPIEDVIFVLSFSSQEIQKSKITIDKAISHRKSADKKSIELKIDSLNPNESANISVLFQSTNSNEGGGAVSLRGKGITGKLIGTEKKNDKTTFFISIAAAYAGIIAFGISTRRGRKILPILVRSLILGRRVGSSGEQKNVLASLLSMYGYPEKAKDYLQSDSSRMYWVEADLLASEAINGDEKVKTDTIEILKSLSNIEVIAEGSKAIVLYNIARIAASSDSDVSSEYLALAKKLDAEEIERRLSIDPLFLTSSETNKSSKQDAASGASS